MTIKQNIDKVIDTPITLRKIGSGTSTGVKTVANNIYTFSIQNTVNNIKYKYNEYKMKRQLRKSIRVTQNIIIKEAQEKFEQEILSTIKVVN